ncbi:unnamed protein product [Lactuca saligna]|uniref:AB hydrolase-1 domain-containing protein n=1 Tax=Lactuca saligna TaxID=75948 RepID=A0AA35YJ79_LACSI|nr:unnamed protein product [Lactuca saligna]
MASQSSGTPGDTRFSISPHMVTVLWHPISVATVTPLVLQSPIHQVHHPSCGWRSGGAHQHRGGPGEDKVFVVGHDWGAMIAWALCLYRPDKVKALVNMSVPFSPRNPKFKPIDGLRALYGNDYYIIRFQEPGEIEGEFAVWGTDRVLNNFFNYRKPAPLFLPKGVGFGTSPDDPIILPSWMSKEDLEYYTSKYEKTGFTGGLNYYRALNLNWELTGPWTGAQVKVPVKFIVGDLDLTYNSMGARDYIEKGGFTKRCASFGRSNRASRCRSFSS